MANRLRRFSSISDGFLHCLNAIEVPFLPRRCEPMGFLEKSLSIRGGSLEHIAIVYKLQALNTCGTPAHVNFNRSKGISEIIAIILVVVLTLVAFGVAYAFVFSTLGRSSSSKSVNVQAQVIGGSGFINIDNTGSVTVSTAVATVAACTVGSLTPSTITAGASGTIPLTACSGAAGSTITGSIAITYVNGAVTQQVITIVVGS